MVARSLGVVTGLESELEAHLDQISNMAGFRVVGGGSCGHDGLDDSKGGGLLMLDGGSLTS